MVELVDQYDEVCIPADPSNRDAAYEKRIGYIQDDKTDKTCIRILTVSNMFHGQNVLCLSILVSLFSYHIMCFNFDFNFSFATSDSEEDEATYLRVLST